MSHNSEMTESEKENRSRSIEEANKLFLDKKFKIIASMTHTHSLLINLNLTRDKGITDGHWQRFSN